MVRGMVRGMVKVSDSAFQGGRCSLSLSLSLSLFLSRETEAGPLFSNHPPYNVPVRTLSPSPATHREEGL